MYKNPDYLQNCPPHFVLRNRAAQTLNLDRSLPKPCALDLALGIPAVSAQPPPPPSRNSSRPGELPSKLLRTPLLKDVKWLQSITSLPILVKGVIIVEYVRLSVESGAIGIIVSNHGARQLDYVPATITALEEVVKAAQGKVPVFLDGGVRRGTDVFKALALGAAGVFIGRLVLFSLAADGDVGVRKALQMLRHEFELTSL